MVINHKYNVHRATPSSEAVREVLSVQAYRPSGEGVASPVVKVWQPPCQRLPLPPGLPHLHHSLHLEAWSGRPARSGGTPGPLRCSGWL